MAVLEVIPGNSAKSPSASPNGSVSVYLPVVNPFLFKIGWLLTTIIKLLQKKRRKEREGQRLESSTLGQCL